jgi:hypothetical protein
MSRILWQMIGHVATFENFGSDYSLHLPLFAAFTYVIERYTHRHLFIISPTILAKKANLFLFHDPAW